MQLKNQHYLIDVAEVGQRFFVAEITYLPAGAAPKTLLLGKGAAEFYTSADSRAADACRIEGNKLILTGRGNGWSAESSYELIERPVTGIRRLQSYHFDRDFSGALSPGFALPDCPDLKYTYALAAHDQLLTGLAPIRLAVDWALPCPFHLWHDDATVAIYGLDKSCSPGTLDFVPPEAHAGARLNVYYPDTGAQNPAFFGVPASPSTIRIGAGTTITFTEYIAAQEFGAESDPLIVAEKIVARILLRQPAPKADLPAVASRIARFYGHCQLWNPDALGAGRGWFYNMWIHTQKGNPAKTGAGSGYYDLGWGEGIAVEFFAGAARHWKRTGETDLLPYVDTMAASVALFRAGSEAGAPYYDRSDGVRFGDFMLAHLPGRRIWSHSLGHSANQLLRLWLEVPDYPNPKTRQAWFEMAESSARFFARMQKSDGDLNDVFDENGQEANAKKFRIPARAVVCGLWTRMAAATGDGAWLARAEKLAEFLAPEIQRLEIYGQMLDGLAAPNLDFMDGEAAYYILEGLVPLYAATRKPNFLGLCQRAAAFGIAWTYGYDLPKAYRGMARGGQCCRMPDFPLLYPIGPAKAVPVLLDLAEATQDEFYRDMAWEMANFIAHWQIDAPGKPWDGGILHAMGQFSGQHWGPDLEGQIDSGMTTGNGLAAIEMWLSHEKN